MADHIVGNDVQQETTEKAIVDAFDEKTESDKNDTNKTSEVAAEMVKELNLKKVTNDESEDGNDDDDDDDIEIEYEDVIAIQEYKYDDPELAKRQISREKRAMTYTTIPISIYTEEEDYNREMPFYVCTVFVFCFFVNFFWCVQFECAWIRVFN